MLSLRTRGLFVWVCVPCLVDRFCAATTAAQVDGAQGANNNKSLSRAASHCAAYRMLRIAALRWSAAGAC